MERKNSWKSMFRRRTLSNVKEPPPSSTSDLEKHFKEAENERSLLFEALLRQFEHDFALAERARNLSDEQREEDFLAAQSQRRERFLESERSRYEQFKQADTDQEAAYRLNEDRRMLSFKDAQQAREDKFEKAIAGHTQQNEWFISTIESLYAAGRKRREGAAQRLLENILKDFYIFLNSMQETSLEAHFRRMGTLKEDGRVALHSRPVTIVSELGVEQIPHLRPPRAAVEPLTPSYRGSRRASPSPPPHSPAQIHSSPRTMVVDPSFTSFDHPLPPSPRRQHGLADFPTTTADTLSPFRQGDSPFRQLLDFHDNSYHDKESQRTREFQGILQTHDKTFQKAEQRRGWAVKLLSSRFQEAEQRFKQQFETSQVKFGDLFNSREVERNTAEAQRTQEFQASMELFRIASQQAQSSFTSRVKALEVAEIHAATSLRDYISETLSSIRKTVHAARKAQDKLFLRSLSVETYRPDDLKTSSRTSLQSLIASSIASPTEIEMPITSPPQAGSRLHAQVSTPRYYRSPAQAPLPVIPSHHRRSPPLSVIDPNFGTRTLFQGPGMVNELPVPNQGHHHPPVQVRDTALVDAYLKIHRIQFAKEQDSRRAKADEILQKWHQISGTNECKRDEEFKTKQMQHAEEADKREIEQSLAFIAAQQEREKAFQSGESARDKLFTQKNGKRSQDFAAFLLRWKAHLQEVHERALAAAREEESKRVKELARKMVVVHGEFLNLIAASKDLLVRDEWKRERKFSEITNERHGV